MALEPLTGFGGLGGFGSLGRTFGGFNSIDDMMGFEEPFVTPFSTSSSAYSYRHSTVGLPGGRTISRSVHQEYTPEGGFKEQVFQDGRPVDVATQHQVCCYAAYILAKIVMPRYVNDVCARAGTALAAGKQLPA